MYPMKICIFEKGSRHILWAVRFSASSAEHALNVQSDHWNQHFVLSDRSVSKLYAKESPTRWRRVGTIYS